MSYALFLFMQFFFNYACMLKYCCIFVPLMYRDKKVDNVRYFKFKCL